MMLNVEERSGTDGAEGNENDELYCEHVNVKMFFVKSHVQYCGHWVVKTVASAVFIKKKSITRKCPFIF